MLKLNPLRYDNIASVDTRFAPILEKNLWKDVTFVPNVSFTTKYQMKAGQIYVRKLRPVNVKQGKATASGGLDFEHTHTQDDLIPIFIDQNFSGSEKIYEAVENARESATGAQTMEVVVNSVKEQFQLHALGVLVGEGRISSITAATTVDTVKENILASRKALRDEGANPDILIASTKIFGFLLEKAGQEYFPNSNEEVLRTGSVGKYYSFNVYESNLIDDGGESGDVEYVLYDHEAYSILYALETVRMVDAGKDFVGSYAQAQMVAGFKVTLPEAVNVKKIGSVTTYNVKFVLNSGKYFDVDGELYDSSGTGREQATFTVATDITKTVQQGFKVDLDAVMTHVAETSIPTNADLEFEGWYYDNASFEFEFAGNRPINKAMTLYARWKVVAE